MAQNNDATVDSLAELAGTGFHAANVETLDERLPLERYTVGGASFVAGPRDDRPGRSDHGDGRLLNTSSEGSSTTKTFEVGDLLVEIEGDYQPDATSPRLRVTEK